MVIALIVYRLGRCPLTAERWVRLPLRASKENAPLVGVFSFAYSGVERRSDFSSKKNREAVPRPSLPTGRQESRATPIESTKIKTAYFEAVWHTAL